MRQINLSLLVCFISFQALLAQTVKQVYQEAAPAVATLLVYNAVGEAVSQGSGVIVRSNGVLFTNFHVVKNAAKVIVRLKSGDEYAASGKAVVDYDAERDFAILKIPAVHLPVVRVGNSNLAGISDEVVAIGSPSGLQQTCTPGIISGVREMAGYKLLQNTAAISPGSSGGGLFNMSGELIGITTSQIKEGQAINFALPVGYAAGALENDPSVKYALPLAPAESSESVAAKAPGSVVTAEPVKTYRDKGQYFSLPYPENWQTQYSAKWNDDKTTLTKTFIAAPKTAEHAVIDGNLSEGVRISYRLAAEGRTWGKKTLQDYADEAMKSTVKSNPGFEVVFQKFTRTDGGTDGFLFEMTGKSDQISEPETDFFYLVVSDRAYVLLELTCPSSKLDAYKSYFQQAVDDLELKTKFAKSKAEDN